MFHSELNLIAIDWRPDLWRFAAPLIWSDKTSADIVVPQGFITDMASIPHLIDWLPNLDRTGLSRRAAALHDWLYGGDRTRGKDFADLTLYTALQSDGMSKVGAWEYYTAVHRFGQSSWDGDNQDLRQEHFFTPADFQNYTASLVGSL